jgi:hypothetical protein
MATNTCYDCGRPGPSLRDCLCYDCARDRHLYGHETVDAGGTPAPAEIVAAVARRFGKGATS